MGEQPWRRTLDCNVYQAAQDRISWAFDTFPRIYLSGPSGKDSGAMMHMVCLEARRRGRQVGVLYVDLEAQYRASIEHVAEMFALYADVIDPHWIALPVHLRNATSMVEPQWIAWDPQASERWVRTPHPMSKTAPEMYPWYESPWSTDGRRMAMEFEEIIEEFGAWYGGEHAVCCLVGIRCGESLNRWRALVNRRSQRMDGRAGTIWKGRNVWNVYPLYDWHTDDVWTYFGRTGLPYNRIYDAMHKAGLTPHQMRICQPYGDDQRKGLHLFHVLEPETWPRILDRVNGANAGALYSRVRGNVAGNHTITLPAGHTWESFCELLLVSMPHATAEHFRNKIAVFLHWWESRGVSPIPQEADPRDEAKKKAPSWRRVCKVLLRNDYGCKGLSFAPQRSTATAYQRYKKLMAKRRKEWGIYG